MEFAAAGCDRARMSKPIWGVALAGVGLGGAVITLQQADNRALRREVELLRGDVQRAVRALERGPMAAPVTGAETGNVGATAGAPTLAADELRRLREELEGLRKNTQALNRFAELAQLAQSAKELEKSTGAMAVKIVPAGELRNVGKATPEAATQSVLAAAIAGDVEAVAGALTFTESARAKADAWFGTLSERVRQEYGAAEKVIALMMARDAAGLTGMQVLGAREVAPDNMGVRIRFASEQGTKDDTLVLRRGTDGWRLLLTDQAVESMARKVSGKK
jgi:hypothetical protein